MDPEFILGDPFVSISNLFCYSCSQNFTDNQNFMAHSATCHQRHIKQGRNDEIQSDNLNHKFNDDEDEDDRLSLLSDSVQVKEEMECESDIELKLADDELDEISPSIKNPKTSHNQFSPKKSATKKRTAYSKSRDRNSTRQIKRKRIETADEENEENIPANGQTRCLENTDKISVTCDICLGKFRSLCKFLDHFHVNNKKNKSKSDSSNVTTNLKKAQRSKSKCSTKSKSQGKVQKKIKVNPSASEIHTVSLASAAEEEEEEAKSNYCDSQNDTDPNLDMNDDNSVENSPISNSFCQSEDEAQNPADENNSIVIQNPEEHNKRNDDENPVNSPVDENIMQSSLIKNDDNNSSSSPNPTKSDLIEMNICPYCRKKFDQQFKLRQHCFGHINKALQLKLISSATKEVGPGETTQFKCISCPRTFVEKTELRRHLGQNYPIGTTEEVEENLKCPFILCSESFQFLCGLKLHKQNHMETTGASKRYKCTEKNCSQDFRYKVHLVKHKLTHSTERHSICDQCGKQFKGKSSLTGHIQRMHKEEIRVRKYKCDVPGCSSQGFYTLQTYKQHKTSVHLKIRAFLCSECGSSFRTPGSLLTHTKKHTGIKKYECSQCDLKFYDRERLKTHFSTHTNERKFRCEFCGLGFNHSSTLRRHRFTHTQQRPNVCPICPKSYFESRSLRKHLELHKKNGEIPQDSDLNAKLQPRQPVYNNNNDNDNNYSQTNSNSNNDPDPPQQKDVESSDESESESEIQT